MKKQQYQIFNLDEVRPKVLLVGNGLTYGTSIPWAILINQVSRDNVDVSRYEKKRYGNNSLEYHLPYNILTLATSVLDDQERHKKYTDALCKQEYPLNSTINRLIKLPFDAILTTNYTYEWEAELNPNYPKYSPKRKRDFAATTEDVADAKYLLHTYNQIIPKSPNIWHIHGELRRPSSMILSHDEYARYIHQILSHNKRQGNDYVNYYDKIKMKSWIDYFLVGDVYILGLSMDYTEFDLWWLLGRRLREKSGCGKMVFYEPLKAENKYKQLALHDCGVSIQNCGVDIDTDGTYNEFYQKAIHDIETNVIHGQCDMKD